jgi:hypothetical protein
MIGRLRTDDDMRSRLRGSMLRVFGRRYQLIARKLQPEAGNETLATAVATMHTYKKATLRKGRFLKRGKGRRESGVRESDAAP